MKKEPKNDILQLQNELEPLAEQIETPQTLSAEGVTELLEEKQPKQKKGKVVAFRAVRAMAAVLAVVIGVTAAFRLYNRPRVRSIPKAIASAESPLSGTTQKDITDYFTALRAQYDKEQRNIFHYGRVVYEKSADVVTDGFALEDGATGAVNSAAVGKTNTQVENVDEQDKIENDGRYLYYAANDLTVRIVDTQTMRQVSRIEPHTKNGTESRLFYKDDLLVLLSTAYEQMEQHTVFRVFDVSDRTAPKLLKTVEQDGWLFDSRLTGNRLVVLSNDSVPIYDLNTRGGYARYEDVVPTTKIDGGDSQPLDAACITIMPQSQSDRYLVITTLDLDTLAGSNPHTFAILGAGDTVYCTEKQLFVAAVDYDSAKASAYSSMSSFYEVKTTIYEFSFMGATVALKNTGSVPGTLNNSFSLDSADGTLRVATTGSDRKSGLANRITVLDENLKEIGSIEGIAPGETIRSVRYIGQYGYVVTFERTDPLFVIDFSNKKKPKIVAELKLPGFSSYLHPFNGYLIGVGTDGDEDGATDGLKLSLFDISDPTALREIDKLVIPHAGSIVGEDHHSFTDNSAQNRFGLVYESHHDYYERRFCTLSVENGRLKLLGTFTNHKSNGGGYPIYEPDGSYTTAYYPEDGIDRGTFIGNTLYTASTERICAWPFDGGDCLGTVELDDKAVGGSEPTKKAAQTSQAVQPTTPPEPTTAPVHTPTEAPTKPKPTQAATMPTAAETTQANPPAETTAAEIPTTGTGTTITNTFIVKQVQGTLLTLHRYDPARGGELKSGAYTADYSGLSGSADMHFAEGDVVTIRYDQAVAETYPMQLTVREIYPAVWNG